MDEREAKRGDEDEAMSADIEGALMDGLDDDPRLGHGVPSHLRGSDLDFIQMTGLTVAGDGEEVDAPEPDADLDPNVPVSFYEEGIDDVDSRMAPLGTEPEAGSADEVIVPSRRTSMSSSIESLREIVADLTAREDSRENESGPAAEVEPERDAEPESEVTDAVEPDAGEVIDDAAEALAEEYFEDIVVPDDEPPVELVVQPSQEWETPPRSPLSDLGPLPLEEEFAGPAAVEEDSPDASSEDMAATPEPVEVPDIEPHPEPPVDVPRATPSKASAVRRPDLAQAESLLQRLEAQTGARAVDDGAERFEMPEIPEATVPDGEAAETDESVYNRPNAPARRYSKRRRARRRLLRLMSLAVLLGALGAGSYYAYLLFEQQTATDADHYQAAARLAERGAYAQAGAAFAAFSTRYPESPLGGDALLMAAHSYEQTGDNAAAIRYYELFRSEYPEHPKVHRATTLLALAQVRAGEYQQAIRLLQDTDRRAVDPDGYLASLRALGEAHAALGQIDEARSAYLRAASLEGNYTADEDYLALAELYQSQANAADGEARRRYLSLAVDQWDFAMRSPGLTESRRRDIKARRDLIISELSRVALSAEAPPDDYGVEPELADAEAVEAVKPGVEAADEAVEAPVEGQAPVGDADEVRGVARN